MIPPATASTIPTMKPPPIIKLKIANGSIIMSASAPCPRIMMTDPNTITNPITKPITNAFAIPMLGNHQKTRDQLAGDP